MMDYSSWVNSEIVKKSNKPFKSGLKVGIVKSMTINPHNPELAFLMNDGSIVNCHQCKLNTQ